MAFATGEAVWGQKADDAARRYGVDPNLFRRLIKQESGWNPNAGSHAGARGLTQVVPKWHPNANLSTPEGQLDYGAKHLGSLLKKYGNPRDALAVYNSGKPWKVSQAYGETNNYVKNILAGYNGAGTAARSAVRAAAGGAPGGIGVQQVPTLDAATFGELDDYVRRSGDAVWAGDVGGIPDVLPLAARINVKAPAAPEAEAHTADDGHNHGGGMPSQAGVAPRPSGDWGGTKGPVEQLSQLAFAEGLKVSSHKRDRRNTASGGVSDHWTGSTSSFAHDLAWGGTRPIPAADRAASAIVSALGGPKNWGKTGGNFVTVKNGIRYQVIYRSDIGGNHWNHIHVGARRVR